MKHRPFIILLILLVVISIFSIQVFASQNEIYDAWHNSGDTWESDEDLYEATIFGNFENLRLKKNGELIIIAEEKCEDVPYFSYCFYEKSFDGDKAFINDRGELEPGFRVIIYELEPDVSISNSPGSINMDLNQQQEITVTISNDGSKNAENGYYRVLIPDGLTVTEVFDGAVMVGNRLEWRGLIGIEKSQSFSYKIRVDNHGEYELVGNFSYFYEGAKGEIDSELEIEAEAPYEIELEFDPSEADINDYVKLNLVITNNDPDNKLLLKDMFFHGPQSITLISSPDQFVKVGSRDFSYSTEIGAGKDSSYEFRYRSSFTGEHNASIDYLIEINKLEYSGQRSDILEVVTEELDGWVALPIQSVRPGEDYRVQVIFKNYNEEKTYYNIEATLSAPLFSDKSFTLEKLESGLQKEIYNEVFKSPSSLVKKDYPFILNGSYKSETGEKFYFNNELDLEVFPVNKSFNLQIDSNKRILKPGENLTVHVYVENLLDDPVYGIKVKAILPDGVELIQGDIESVVDVFANEQIDALVYKLHLPDDFSNESDQLEFTAIMNATVIDEPFGMEITDSVEIEFPEEQAPVFEEDEEEPEEEYVEPEQVKKKGFLSEFFEGIENFFKNLLS